MPTKPAQPVKDELAHYGVPPGVVRTFDGREATSDLIDYLDLVESPRRLGANEDVRPDGVAEVQGRPLLFFVNESRLATSFLEQPQQLEKLSRALACRGDQAYLARIRPGELLVAKVSLTRREPQWRPYTAGTGDAITFFSRLAHGIREDAETDTAERRSVFQEMLRLLNNAANKLATGLPPADVLSLIGRSLFFRFLIDRGVVAPHDLGQVCPAAGSLEDCFVDAQSAQQTCAWLDRTFNGDFLPLSGDGGAAFFANLGGSFPATFTHLTAIMQRWDPAGGGYQGKLRWAKFDFAHVPVGLLSQVYEAFCWEWEHRTSKATSVHYTPRHLATTLVEEAFDGLPRAQDARVLDCACGAGVFLVLAFRRLYQERWAATGVRPDTKAIRAILERQLAGFDISESALKLAALSLYLTAIELDPVPVPPEKLRFKDPMGTVLFNHRRPEPQDPADGPVLGSLGPHVNRRFDGQFDVVLSNPPWTSLSEKFKDPLTSVCRDVLSRAGERELAGAYSNPDIEPDLPFVLRSTEWCRPGGRIAMALPARILLKQADTPRRARETLFKLIQVTGIINGSNLADTDVWPGMSQPFMLLFAVNQRPIGSHVVRFITPQYDERLNRGGQLAIDSKSAQPLRLSETTRYPWFWKAHAVGTVLDIEVTRRLMEAHAIPLKEYWGKEHLGLVCGKGFQDAPKQKQQAAPFMRKYPELSDTRKFRFLVDTTQLELSVRRKACFPRKEEIYAAPLERVTYFERSK